MKALADLIGDSPGLRSVRETIARLLTRQTDTRRLPSILIQGETGTGKSLLARMIHRAGPRPDGPFIDVNCAAIPDTLLEAEMFGFERGAFTDARRSKPGLFQAAHRGTIFLDEVGLLPEALQAKLLKVLEDRTVRRLGATRDEPIDVWILTATNEDLKVAIRERRFREDLYHRLAVLTVTLPPLRERGGDILALAEHFLARVCAEYGVPRKTLAADARRALGAYRWPGNVRELSNVLERAVLMSSATEVTAQALALGDAEGPAPAPAAEPAPAPVSLDDAMRAHLVEVFTRTDWNISRTAALLGISRNTLRARMDKYGLREGEGARRTASSRFSPRAGGRPNVRPPGPGPVTVEPAGASASEMPPVVQGRRWERRRLAVLRVALVPAATPDAPLAIARALETVVEKVKTFGGRVHGIGPIGVVAVFGLDAAGDATDRAAHTALSILKSRERARHEEGGDVGARITLHAGSMLVGLTRNSADPDMDDWRDLWPLLDELIERAPRDRVLVTASAASLLIRRFELTAGPGPVRQAPTHLLIGREHTGLGLGGRLTDFMGRQQELDLLGSRLALVLAGHGQVVGIAGDAGIGKSRLVFELRQTLAAPDVRYLEAHCHAHGTDMAYLPVIELVRALCGIRELDTPDAVHTKIEATLVDVGLDAPTAARYLLHLLGVKTATTSIADLQPETIKPRTLDVLRQLVLRHSRQRPLVIAFDDLHWIDAASEEYLSSLADVIGAGAPILLLATYRPGYRPPWGDRSYATQIALRPLLTEDSRRVLLAALGPEHVETGLQGHILAKAEGNPFFLEELARVVRTRMNSNDPPVIPDTIQDVLLARIDRLLPEDRELLQTASAVGKDVSVELLQAAVDASPAAVGRSLARLRAAEFLVESPGAPEGELTFRHALTQEVTYATISAATRKVVDARIVTAIERLHTGRLGEHLERLAHHAFRGELWDRAADYLRQAGRKATARSAYREASACFDRALLALDHLPRTLEILHRSIDVRFDLRTSLTPLAEYARLGSVLDEAEAIAAMVGDQRTLGRVSAYVSDYFRLMGDQERAVVAGGRALDIAHALGELELEVMANTYLGLAYYTRAEHRRAAEFFRANLGRLVGDLERQTLGMAQLPAVHSRAWLAACLGDLGEFAEAAALAADANRLAESVRHPLSRAVAEFALGHGPLRQGAASEAVPPLERSFNLTREWNFGLWLPTVGAALGIAYVLSGRVDEAIAILEQAAAHEAGMKRVGSHSARLAALSHGYLAAGRADAALAAATQALSLSRSHGERGYEAAALRMLGEIHAASGEHEAATGDYGAALGLSQSLGLRPLLAQCHFGLAAVHRLRSHTSDARRHLAEAVSMFEVLGMRSWLERAAAEGERLG